MKDWFTIMVLLALTSLLLITGCTQNQTLPSITQQATPVSDTIKVAPTSLGNILVDGQGKTLYYFADDIPASGASVCSGSCAVIWPVFYSNSITVSPPLLGSDFSSIVRADGMNQTTYRGWPLYYFQGDTNLGDVNGENVNKNWFVVKPDETLMIAQRPTLGLFLVDKMGNTLYYFAKDTPGSSVCTGSCPEKWPPFSAGFISVPSVLDPAGFSTLTRANGLNQTLFMGRPLYYFANDTKSGDTNGEGFNNLWYVANISGTVPNIPTLVSTTAIPTQTTILYSGGY
ncbi:hypothetical protein [Methanoregula sp.]|uniref:hypothetical protein n=1 Tax=Methanoregula sp. TaxID=2052170 RepID=UPI003C74B9BF